MRVLLADDHPLFLDGLQNLMTSRGVSVAGTALDGLEAVDKARALYPDVILMDIQMPRLDGLAATRLIKAEQPQINIVMLTMLSDDDALFEAIKSGASGYLLKTLDTDAFFHSFLSMAQGEAALSPGIAERILKEFGRNWGRDNATHAEPDEALSARQRQVLTLVTHGLTYKEVGSQLNLSERTVKYHMGEIVQRLHLQNRAQAMHHAARAGLGR